MWNVAQAKVRETADGGVGVHIAIYYGGYSVLYVGEKKISLLPYFVA